MIKYFLFALTLLISSTSFALNVQRFHPTVDGTGTFSLEASETLDSWEFSGGTYLDINKNPFESVKWHFGMDAVLAAGITDFFEAGLDIKGTPFTNVEDPGALSDRHSAEFSDLTVKSKLSIFQIGAEKFKLGLSILPFVTFPTGNESHFTGDSKISGGLRAITDLTFGENILIIHAGYNIRDREMITNMDVDDEILVGLGYTRPIIKKMDLYIVGELTGSTVARHFLNSKNLSPAEFNAGIRKFFHEHKGAVTLSGGAGLDNGYGSPDYRITTGISYNFNLFSSAGL